MSRDLGSHRKTFRTLASAGRTWAAVIGIDRYRAWQQLNNAVNDARGVLKVFEELGFESAAEPLFNEAASYDAIRRVVDGMRDLQTDDSLIVFFAGHGHTVTTRFSDGESPPVGYLMPADADHSKGRRTEWLHLEEWLGTIAALPPRHILVVLDCCRSGIALGHEAISRSREQSTAEFALRVSRTVIASAQENEPASDGGPVPGHSVFTGCLIHAIRGGYFAHARELTATPLALFDHITKQVRAETNHQQNPAFGNLDYHNGGELRMPLLVPAKTARGRKAGGRTAVRPQPDVRPMSPPPGFRSAPDAVPARSEGWVLDAGVAASLDRHGDERMRGAQVLSLIAGEPLAAQTAWATWAADRGYLTLSTDSRDLATAVGDLLRQMPWLRCIAAARKRLAAAARVEDGAIDAELDARGKAERVRWYEGCAALDRHALVSGWLLSALRDSFAQVPDLTTAPVQGAELLTIACDLACPTAVLIQHAAPDEAWLSRAIGTAAQLVGAMPRRSVAVTAPAPLVDRVVRAKSPAALVMARQGLVKITAPTLRTPGRGHRSTVRALFDALARDPRTRGQFELDGQLASVDGERVTDLVEIELVARRARLAIELDSWHHFQDAGGYRRDRISDQRLSRAGYFVLRFLTEDVDRRIGSTLNDIALALAGRRVRSAQP